MFEKLIHFAINQRWLIMLIAIGMAVLGIFNYQKLPIDAVPDITNIQVQINTSAPGYHPLETEQRITYPIETAMAGLPKLEQTRSISRYGLSQVTIVFKEGRKQRVMVVGDEFIIQGHKLTPAKAKIQVEDFLIDKASQYLLPRARGLARHLGVEHKITEIKLRKTKSKWGHCTSTGVLQYNWLIMLAPYSIIDYMITHEVCHLLHMDHSSRFWKQVEAICPDCDHYIGWLKEHEHRLWF